MLLKPNGITDLNTWFRLAPPMGGDKQWREGRSAMELARYMTANFPHVPREIEAALLPFSTMEAEFDWAAEYVTDFARCGLGRGEGRNHDAFMYNADVVVGIEGKADEPLGSQLIGEALEGAGENKRHRIEGLAHMLYGEAPECHASVRYQLLTAVAATLLEAKEKKVPKALLLIIVFKRKGCYSDKKIERNRADISHFLSDIGAVPLGDALFLPTHFGKENGITLYFQHIEIEVG